MDQSLNLVFVTDMNASNILASRNEKPSRILLSWKAAYKISMRSLKFVDVFVILISVEWVQYTN